MKRLLFISTMTIMAFSCTSKKESTVKTLDPHQFGSNYDSTASMDVIKATFRDMEKYDTLSYVKKYADTAVFIDNGEKMSLAENVSIQRNLIAAGVKAKVNDDYKMWASEFNFKDGTQGHYVYAYLTAEFSKGGKSVAVVFFQADKFNKDGKITHEYLVYDQSKLGPLMK